ncbi:MAG: ribosome small subunit-dependent GTPase A [Planctomycetia bacterium]|nr:ribosome small subunit-dependent GTPase A [Planctomycetia bacterium]
MAAKKNRKDLKIRVEFRKNRGARTRKSDLTREVLRESFQEDELLREERVRGKGELWRQRTIRVKMEESEDSQLQEDGRCLSFSHGSRGEDLTPRLRVAENAKQGIVLRVHGLNTLVEDIASGVLYRCTVRRLLKTLSTSQRHVVVAGDTVVFRLTSGKTEAVSTEYSYIEKDLQEVSPYDESFGMEHLQEGVIERINARHGCLCRTSRGRMHTLVANIDQAILVASAACPGLKPNLLDRMIIMAEKMGVRPVLCINKVDLVEKLSLMPLLGVYARMGYDTLLVSTLTGEGIPRLRRILRQPGVRSVITGQSGVGKSSLLNAVEEGLNLRTCTVSEENEKGRHTTSAAELIKLTGGGYVVDTPGIRQFELWDVVPAEVAGYFRDIRPYASLCRFSDCTHTHEIDCAVKEAVEEGFVDERRYKNYCQIMTGNVESEKSADGSDDELE